MKNQLLLILLLLYTIFFQVNIVMCKTYSISYADTLRAKKTEKPLRSGQSITIANLKNLPKDNYPIQLGAFRFKANAEALQRKTAAFMGDIVKIIEEDGYYKVRLTSKNNNKGLEYLRPVFSSGPARDGKINFFVNPDTNKITVSVSDTTQIRTAIADSQQVPSLFL